MKREQEMEDTQQKGDQNKAIFVVKLGNRATYLFSDPVQKSLGERWCWSWWKGLACWVALGLL